jgi:putative peptidoglycan lipid II flippase
MFLKIISILGSLTFLSRILGYVRDLLIARIMGAGLVSDAFFISFKLPNLFRRLFAEGSMNAAFIPIVSGIKSKFGKKRSDEFFSLIFSSLLIFLFFLLIVVEIFMPLIIKLIAPGFNNSTEKFILTVDLSRLTFPFVFFICLTSLAGAYLNTMGRFAAMALTPIILNLTIIFCLIIFFKNDDKIIVSTYLSASISFAGLMQLLWMAINLKTSNVKFKFISPYNSVFTKTKKETNKFLILLIPAIIGNGAYQINLLIDMILASTLSHGSISYLYFADRVNQLPLGVLGIAISTALLPILSKAVKENKLSKANSSISESIKFGIFFSVPSFVGIFLLSNEIISFLFLRGEFTIEDAQLTSSALTAFSFGLPAFILIKILVVPFFANEDTKTPIKVSIFSMGINLILNFILIREFLHVGLAIATSVAAWVNVLILFYILLNKLGYKFDKSIVYDFLKILFSSFLMGCVLIFMINLETINFVVLDFSGKYNLLLIITIFTGGMVYLMVSHFIGIRYIYSNRWWKRN